MDRRSRNFTPRGRGRGRGRERKEWIRKEHPHNSASGATANLSGDAPSSSKDDVPQSKSFGESSNRFSQVNTPKSQYREISNSPTSSDGKKLDLVNDVSRLEVVVNPNSVSNASSNLTYKRHELCGSGKEQLVDDDEKSGNSVCFGTSSPGTFSQCHGLASGAISNLPVETSSSSKDDVPQSKSFGESSNQFDHVTAPKSQNRKISNSPTSSDGKKLDLVNDVSRLEGAADANSLSQIDSSNKDDILSEQTSQKEIESKRSDNLNCQSSGVPFDICQPSSVNLLKPSFLEVNRAKRAEAKRIIEGQKINELRSGMVLLEKYISYDDQVKIVKEIRDLGVGVGGFYEPGYRDGGKLQLKMMCLGKNWDPQKREYGDKRQTDDSKPPSLPNFFQQLVKGAIEASHSFLKERSKSLDVKRVLPLMSPNICIVNFYTTSGRLGLHQDKDESIESLRQQLPVVSFSIGDSAVFLYGDERDPEKADKVVLESGDVLIFGGKSRLVYHGVASIETDTAPKALLEETCLRPGRLNLTFREF